MTATPALSNDLAGKYQKKISDDLYLDRKESEGVLIELRAFAAELLNQYHQGYYGGEGYNTSAEMELIGHDVITNSDPGDEHES